MKWLILTVAAPVFLFGTISGTAFGSATVTSFSADCGQFNASGTTTAPFVVYEVYSPTAGVDLFFNSFPSVAGTFSHTVSYPSIPGGTLLEVWVWGSPDADPEHWDGQPYFFQELSCVARPIPTTDLRGLIVLAAALAALGFHFVRRRRNI